jgi:hypothetical protein
MVDVEFSEILRRQRFLASHKVHHLSELVNEDTNTVVTPARFKKLDNEIEGHYVVCQGFSGTGNGCNSP